MFIISEDDDDGWHELLTTPNNPPMSDETAYNSEGQCSGRPSLIPSESVQPMQDGFDTEDFQVLWDSLCAVLSRVKASHQREQHSLNLPCLTCSVAIARVERISAIISTTMTLMAAVRVIVV